MPLYVPPPAAGGALTVKEEGVALTTAASSLDFAGAGVVASGTGVDKLITIPGGSGGGRTLNGTYGDEFTGGSLDAKWTRHNQTVGMETYAQGRAASMLRVAHGAVNAAEYIYQTAPNGTNETWEAKVSWFQENVTNQMFALLMVDGSGNGIAAFVYDNANGLLLANVASHVYSSALTSNTNLKPTSSFYQSGGPIWIKLRKATGLYAASYSFDGEAYSAEVTGTPSAFTPTRVGIGRILGTNANSFGNWDFFDKTA